MKRIWKLRVTDAEKLPKWAVICHAVSGVSLRSGPQPMLELDVPAIRDWLQKHDPAPVGGVIRSIPGLNIYQDVETAVR